LPGGTSVPAPTMQCDSTTALSSRIAPMPMMLSWCTVQPWTIALCPTVTRSPSVVVERPAVTWSTASSCTDVPAPMTIGPSSPRRVAHGHTLERGPIVTWPMSTAREWT